MPRVVYFRPLYFRSVLSRSVLFRSVAMFLAMVVAMTISSVARADEGAVRETSQNSSQPSTEHPHAKWSVSEVRIVV